MRLGVGLLGLATGTGAVGAHGANDTYYDGHMVGDWGHMGGWGGGWWLLHGLFWLVVIAVAVAAIYWVASDRGDGDGDAVAILRQQYARGEIDHDEFEERRRRLEE